MFKNAKASFYIFLFAITTDLCSGAIFNALKDTDLNDLGCSVYFLGSAIAAFCYTYVIHLVLCSVNKIESKYIHVFTSFAVGLYGNNVFVELFGNPLESCYPTIAVIFLIAVFKLDQKVAKYIKLGVNKLKW